jgi:cystathionine beta-lyase
VWRQNELEQLARICRENRCRVLSDEIHCDLTLFEHKFTPFQKLYPENTVTFMAPTKTFNLAGLKTSFMIIENEELRHLVEKHLFSSHIQYGGVVTTCLIPVVYSEEGRKYILQLKKQLERNILYFEAHLPLKVLVPEASFLVWVDGREEVADLTELFVKKCKIQISPGLNFGGDARFEQFVRGNSATDQLEEIVERIKGEIGN